MRIRHKNVEVRITRRTLWVDNQAYPLQHITSVRPREFRPRRWRMVVAYLRRAGGWLGLGVVGLIALGCLGDSISAWAMTVLAVPVLGVLGFHTVRLIRLLRTPTVHVLSIGTAGATNAVVTSTNAQQITHLAQVVVDALDNPAMDYTVHIDHIEIIHGDKIGGDKVEGDKIMAGFVERDKVAL